jgi:effector-binding domain-containing protein
MAVKSRALKWIDSRAVPWGMAVWSFRMQNGKFFAAAGHIAKLVLLLATMAAPLPSLAQPSPAEPPKTEAPKEAPAPNAAPADSSAAPTEDSSIQTAEVAARVVIKTPGAASWEEGYGKIGEALAKLRASAEKAGLKVTGRPLAVFTDTDDAGFKFEAMLPVEAAPDAKPDLGADISLAQSPSGKAIKFQHRGAYDDIDTTYDAITAYLDEKGLEARNLFVEEYLTDAKDSSDMALQVDIFVFLK